MNYIGTVDRCHNQNLHKERKTCLAAYGVTGITVEMAVHVHTGTVQMQVGSGPAVKRWVVGRPLGVPIPGVTHTASPGAATAHRHREAPARTGQRDQGPKDRFGDWHCDRDTQSIFGTSGSLVSKSTFFFKWVFGSMSK